MYLRIFNPPLRIRERRSQNLDPNDLARIEVFAADPRVTLHCASIRGVLIKFVTLDPFDE